jgi:hypothetical protein
MALQQFHLLPPDGADLAPGLLEDDPCVVIASAWIDLTDGPVVLHLPHTHGRHFDLTLIDTAGEPFASLGTRTDDDGGVDCRRGRAALERRDPARPSGPSGPERRLLGGQPDPRPFAARPPEALAIARSQRLSSMERRRIIIRPTMSPTWSRRPSRACGR